MPSRCVSGTSWNLNTQNFHKWKTFQYAIPKINMLHNLSCLETRFRLLCRWYLLHSSLNLVFRQHKLHNLFIFGMAYRKNEWFLGSLQVWQVVCEVSSWHKRHTQNFWILAKIHFSARTENKIHPNTLCIHLRKWETGSNDRFRALCTLWATKFFKIHGCIRQICYCQTQKTIWFIVWPISNTDLVGCCPISDSFGQGKPVSCKSVVTEAVSYHSPSMSFKRGKKKLCHITFQGQTRSSHTLPFSDNNYWLIPLISGERGLQVGNILKAHLLTSFASS